MLMLQSADERERDLRPRVALHGVDAHAGGYGPEALKLGAQLVGQRHAGLDQVLMRADQRPERLGRIRVGDEHPVAVTAGRRQLGEHKAGEAVALAARRRERRADP